MSYRHLSAGERHVIYHLRLIKLSFREIGRRLERHHTTIAREVARHGPPSPGHVYVGEAGERRYRAHKGRAQHRRRRGHGPLWRYVGTKLAQRWSPEQIAGRLPRDFPGDPAMRLCPETVYSWVYDDAKAGGQLHRYLRRAHKKRRKQKRLAAFRGPIKNRVSIHQRPQTVAARSRVGDWEGDTVMGAQGKGALVTLVERNSRLLLAARLADKTADGLASTANRLFKPLPASWKQTLTLDNGSEFARFKAIEKTSRLAVYFADPYAAWQRGLNENTNGLIRQYFPKGCDFLEINHSAIASVVTALNNRPRKCLGYRTPNEVRKLHSGALSTGI